jgi:NAD-dependent deacetylase
METATENQQTIGRIVNLLASSRSILFITGAGISVDSGLPTFRNGDGVFCADVSEEGVPMERALSCDLLCDHPELTWKCLARIECAWRGARHNRAHEVIAQMEQQFERVWTLTQNVDGLHHSAGTRNLIEIHGDLRRLRCMRCLHRQTVADYSELTLPPRCPKCPGLLRPDVVLFDEPLSLERLMTLFTELDQGFDLVFSVGTSSVFSYIAEPVRMAAQLGRPTVEINPGVSEVSDLVDIKLSMRAAPALDAIWQAYQQQYSPRAAVSAAQPQPRSALWGPAVSVDPAGR